MIKDAKRKFTLSFIKSVDQFSILNEEKAILDNAILGAWVLAGDWGVIYYIDILLATDSMARSAANWVASHRDSSFLC